MDPVLNQEWTSSEVEEATSLVIRLKNNKIIYDDNDDKTKKHNDIVDALHALFPSKSLQHVADLYVDLVIEMHTMLWRTRTMLLVEAHIMFALLMTLLIITLWCQRRVVLGPHITYALSVTFWTTNLGYK